MSPIVYFEGNYVPEEQAKVSIKTHAFLYGTSLFEGIRGYWNEQTKSTYLFRVREHFERMLGNLPMMWMDTKLTVEALEAICTELVLKNDFGQDIYLQPRFYKSGQIVPPQLDGVDTDYCCFILPFGDYLDTQKGLSVCVSSWCRLSDNMIPPRGKIGGAYVNTGLAMAEAHQGGFDDAIFLTAQGKVAEGTGMNIFLVRDGKLITPRITDGILEGITRASILELAREEMDIVVEERCIDRSELYMATEVFFTGTAAQVAPVTTIDYRQVGNGKIGEVTKTLQGLYNQAVHGQLPKYNHWLTRIDSHAYADS